MLFINKKEKQVEEKLANGQLSISPYSAIGQRFRKNKLAKWSLRILFLLIFISVFADFIANEKPLYCKIEGETYFPICKQYFIDLGLAKLDARFFQNDWDEHDYEAVVFPPIPYSPKTIDNKNRGYVGPFDKQEIQSARYRHWLGTDNLGHDIAAGMVSGTRVALLVGLIAMSIASIIGIALGAMAGFLAMIGLRQNGLVYYCIWQAYLLGGSTAFKRGVFNCQKQL